jgi:hypothetical protein
MTTKYQNFMYASSCGENASQIRWLTAGAQSGFGARFAWTSLCSWTQ